MKKIPIFCLALAVLTASFVSLARPIRGTSAASSEEFPAIDLPYDAEVKYLASSGTQWIVIPYNKTKKIEITTKLSFLGPNNIWSYAFSLIRDEPASYSWAVRYYGGTTYLLSPYTSVELQADSQFQENTIRIYTPNPSGGYPKIYAEVNGVKVPGYTYNDVTVGTSGTLLFGHQEYNTATPIGSSVRIYFFYGEDADGNKIDLIPVRFTNEFDETEGALYDRVSNTLFRNQGTGSFIIGPDL